MKMLVTVCMLVCLLVAIPVRAQDLPRDVEAQGASGIMASAARAAMRLELQPNAAPQRSRRGGRISTGWTLVAIGGGLFVTGLVVANSGGGRNEFGYYESDNRGTMGTVLALGGMGLGAVGGIVIALADSTPAAGAGPNPPHGPHSPLR